MTQQAYLAVVVMERVHSELPYSDSKMAVVDKPSLDNPREIHTVALLPDLSYLQLPPSQAPYFLVVADQKIALMQSSYYHSL
jgi:hypothetical protein